MTGDARRLSDLLWIEAMAFANAAGHCTRSDEWHEQEVCLTCQELVNFARHILKVTKELR